jgi:diguanylate cyclase (GGDEF)-like protein
MRTFLLLIALLPGWASAACIVSPDPGIRKIQSLIQQNANRALAQLQAGLDRLPPDPPGRRPNPRRAALYAAEAEAFGILERSEEARAAAARGLELAPAVDDPVHLELLSAAAENVYDEAGIAAALEGIESARRSQAPDSRAATCLLITRGLLEHRQDRADLAIASLTQAYRASAQPAMIEPHIQSASVLSVVMRSMGDYQQALALNQEEIEWAAGRGATLSLSVARFMRGQILKLMSRFAEAIEEFGKARRLSVTLGDGQGIAYADLRLCEVYIDLGNFDAAQPACAQARSAFAAAQVSGSMKEAQALQARIDLGQGRAERAVAMFDEVLDHQGLDLPPIDVASLYDWRARANAALHDYQHAYADLREYARRYTAAIEAERGRETGALRARFETDREIERNASLKHALAVSEEQSRRQAQQLRWNAMAAVTGGCIIVLLIYILIANIRYRQQMVKLASLDGLTGLPNRRRTAEFAAGALQSAIVEGHSLTLAIIDMDHFKIINDCCGHAAGDHVLKAFARAGREVLRHGDLLGRWGGEEFLIVMPDSTREVGMATLERLRTLMCAIQLPPSGAGLKVTMSAGLSEFEPNVKSLDELIARADKALYAAKSAGRDCVRIADASQVTGSHNVRAAQRS